MLAALGIAVLIVGLSMLAGSVLIHALGARRPIWAEGAVGLAALTAVAGLAIRLPGRAVTTAAVILVLLAAGSFAARKGFGPRQGDAKTDLRQDLVGLAVVLVMLLAAILPFVVEGRAGVLGEGIYTNDHAAQLYWTDWLQNGFGPEPTAVAWGYPVGPQSLVAAIAEVTGASLVDAFNGLLIAIPVLTALAALSLLWRLAPVPRVVSACLAGLPFLAASFLAQSAFKETVMALFVLGFAAVLALATEPGADGEPDLARRAALGAGAALVLGALFAYSVPALAWFGVTALIWLVVVLARGERRIDPGALAATIRRRRVALVVVAIALLAIAAVSAGRVGGFLDRIGDVSASTGRLSSPIFPGEALAVWPEGDFRLVRGDVSGAFLATALGALAVLAGALVLWRRRAYAVLSALAAGAVIYAGARLFSSIYVEAKALAIMAPLVVVVALGGLLAARGGGLARALRLLGVAFAVGAAVSTFLALRAAPVGFADRGEELERLAERIGGEPVAFLGVDRFAAYWLRGTLVRSPGGYVPPEVSAREGKVWQQGRALDLDTLAPAKLDEFDYAITTTAPYQSSPPPNMEEVERTDSYVLWERVERTPRTKVLNEGGAPGAVLEPDEAPLIQLACRRGRGAPGSGSATVLPKPVVGRPGAWSRPVPFDAPGAARQTLKLARGSWQLSIQYHSQVDLTLSAADLRAELPASLVGMYLTHQGQSAFWPAGEVEVPEGSGELEVTVEADKPAALARLAGATRRVWLGEIAATRLDPLTATAPTIPLGAACGRYVDRYDPG